jgi:DNA-binding MarR family transcriptional regulator
MGNEFETAEVPNADADLQSLVKAIRVIAQAIDTRSKSMSRLSGLTIPQAVILQGVRDMGEVTTNGLSRHVDLSPGTVVSILDKLEERGLVERYRNASDRRVVHTRMTAAGAAILATAPSLLPDELVGTIRTLPEDDRRSIVGAFQAVASMLRKVGEPPAPAQAEVAYEER